LTLFHIDGMQTHETASEPVDHKGTHKYPFSHAKDARNRKVRGLWVRGERFYAQIRVPGKNIGKVLTAKAGRKVISSGQDDQDLGAHLR
jgi:hypothetical protein